MLLSKGITFSTFPHKIMSEIKPIPIPELWSRHRDSFFHYSMLREREGKCRSFLLLHNKLYHKLLASSNTYYLPVLKLRNLYLAYLGILPQCFSGTAVKVATMLQSVTWRLIWGRITPILVLVGWIMFLTSTLTKSFNSLPAVNWR